MRTGRIADNVKAAIVRLNARWETPKQVVAAIKEEFGLELSPQSIEGYDPTKYNGRDLSKKWREVFDRERKRFKEDVSDIPIASKAYRLASLASMHREAVKAGNRHQAAQLLEQAAKEVGDVFTNKQKIEGKLQTTARVVMVPAKDGQSNGAT